MADASPADGSEATVLVQTLPVGSQPHVPTGAIVHYRSGDRSYDGTDTDDQGLGRVTFDIGEQPAGVGVIVQVGTGSGQSCSTYFTPT